MACCSTDADTAMSNKIDRDLRKARRDVQKTVRVLLLGSAESGKSTFVKQMFIIHGRGEFNAEESRQYKVMIYKNCLVAMRILIDARQKLGFAWQFARDSQPSADVVFSFATSVETRRQEVDTTNFSPIAKHLDILWSDGAIRNAYEHRSLFQISDSCAYFFEHIKRLSQFDYLPTNRDILMCRKPTTSITDYKFDIAGVPFRFTDVGGQRTQRQKWFQCFNAVTSIVFLTASNEYDQVISEDRRTNRVVESRNVFETIVNHREFQRLPVILFMNKTDLLTQKVTMVRCSDYLPDFKGDNKSATEVQLFLLGLFESCRHNRQRPFFYHFTTAIDTQNIRRVFNDCRDIILEQSVREIMMN